MKKIFMKVVPTFPEVITAIGSVSSSAVQAMTHQGVSFCDTPGCECQAKYRALGEIPRELLEDCLVKNEVPGTKVTPKTVVYTTEGGVTFGWHEFDEARFEVYVGYFREGSVTTNAREAGFVEMESSIESHLQECGVTL